MSAPLEIPYTRYSNTNTYHEYRLIKDSHCHTVSSLDTLAVFSQSPIAAQRLSTSYLTSQHQILHPIPSHPHRPSPSQPNQPKTTLLPTTSPSKTTPPQPALPSSDPPAPPPKTSPPQNHPDPNPSTRPKPTSSEQETSVFH